VHKVLFVCTANIFRSRFSEEVYNYLAKKTKLSSKAFSAGLKVGNYKTRKIYSPAIQQLKLLNIVPKREDELSVHINDLNLKDFNRIICMDKNEHQAMVHENKKLNKFYFEYWDIIDEPAVSSKISLPKCYERVEKLIEDNLKELNT